MTAHMGVKPKPNYIQRRCNNCGLNWWETTMSEKKYCPTCEKKHSQPDTPKPVRNMKEAFSYTTQVGGTTWDPTKDRAPFRVMTGLGHLEDTLRDGGIKREEEEAKAPKILPFPLDRIIDQLAKNYETLVALRVTILISIRSALLSKEDKTLLRHNLKRIDYMVNLIKKMSSDVERVHL